MGGPCQFEETDYRDQADFRCALRRFLRFSEEQAARAGVTPQQHLLLLVIRGHGAYPRVMIRDLEDALQLRQSSVSLLVDRCVRRGLVERREDPEDRRRVMISLSETGQGILDQIMLANRRHLGMLEGSLFRGSFRRALQEADKNRVTSET